MFPKLIRNQNLFYYIFGGFGDYRKLVSMKFTAFCEPILPFNSTMVSLLIKCDLQSWLVGFSSIVRNQISWKGTESSCVLGKFYQCVGYFRTTVVEIWREKKSLLACFFQVGFWPWSNEGGSIEGAWNALEWF